MTLDGVPESLALGVTLAAQGSVALLAAIFIANVGEALGGAAELRQGVSRPGGRFGRGSSPRFSSWAP